MLYFDQFLKAGEPTACAPLDFVKEARKRTTLIDPAISDETLQDYWRRYFEQCDRWEFITVDDAGKTVAVMAVYVDDCDPHKAEPVLTQLCSNSLVAGALAPGYRFMVKLAREKGINWIYTTRSEGEGIPGKYHKVSKKQ